jgi:hypothetical protein
LNYDSIGALSTVSGPILLLLSFVGFYGSYKYDIRFLMILAVGGTLAGLIILLMSGFVLHIKSISGEVLMSKSQCLKNFKPAESLTSKGVDVLCSKYCPCELSKQGFFEGTAAKVTDCNPCENIQFYEVQSQSEVIQWISDNLRFNVTSTACAITADDFVSRFYSSEDTSFIEFVSWMEKEFQCSGMCHEQDIFLFSDVTNGKPNGPCYQMLKVWATRSFLAFGIVSVIFAVFEILTSVLSIFYIVILKKKSKEMPTQVEVTHEKKDCSVISENSNC